MMFNDIFPTLRENIYFELELQYNTVQSRILVQPGDKFSACVSSL